jgi:hypothetical protein
VERGAHGQTVISPQSKTVVATDLGMQSASFLLISADQVVGFGLAIGELVLSGGIDEVVDPIETNMRNI